MVGESVTSGVCGVRGTSLPAKYTHEQTAAIVLDLVIIKKGLLLSFLKDAMSRIVNITLKSLKIISQGMTTPKSLFIFHQNFL